MKSSVQPFHQQFGKHKHSVHIETFHSRGDSQILEDERTYVRVQETPSRTFLVVLEINDVVESDAGLYKVKAKNKYGEVAASINLNFSREFCILYFFFVLRRKKRKCKSQRGVKGWV